MSTESLFEQLKRDKKILAGFLLKHTDWPVNHELNMDMCDYCKFDSDDGRYCNSDRCVDTIFEVLDKYPDFYNRIMENIDSLTDYTIEYVDNPLETYDDNVCECCKKYDNGSCDGECRSALKAMLESNIDYHHVIL